MVFEFFYFKLCFLQNVNHLYFMCALAINYNKLKHLLFLNEIAQIYNVFKKIIIGLNDINGNNERINLKKVNSYNFKD